MIMETRDGMKILPWTSIVTGILFNLSYVLEVIFLVSTIYMFSLHRKQLPSRVKAESYDTEIKMVRLPSLGLYIIFSSLCCQLFKAEQKEIKI